MKKAELERRLKNVPGWTLAAGGKRIEMILMTRRFADAIALVNRVARLAEAHDHHPDIDIRYTRVKLSLTTHDEGGLTDRDFRMAKEINGLLAG